MRQTISILNVAIAFFFMTAAASAQDANTLLKTTNAEVGLRLGLNFHRMSGANATGDVGVTFGAWGTKKLNDKLSFQAELLYLEQGGAQRVDFFGFDVDAEFNLDYLTVPLMVKYHPLNFLSVHAGIQPGFALKKETVTSGILTGQQVSGIDDMKNFDTSALFGIDVKVPYWDGNWSFSAQYRTGLTNIYDGIEGGTIKNKGFALTATYTIPLSDLLSQ